jgi:hypothetical protein
VNVDATRKQILFEGEEHPFKRYGIIYPQAGKFLLCVSGDLNEAVHAFDPLPVEVVKRPKKEVILPE